MARGSRENRKAAHAMMLRSFPGATLWTMGDHRLGGGMLAVYAAGIPLYLFFLRTGWLLKLSALHVLVVLIAGVWEWSVIDSVVDRLEDPPKRLARLPFWINVAFGTAAALGIGSFVLWFGAWGDALGGMEPTLRPGERVICQKASSSVAVERGDVVVAEVETQSLLDGGRGWKRGRDGRLYLLGRVVGVGGDVVEVEPDGVSVNDRKLPYRGGDPAFEKAGLAERSWVVPEGSFFLAGDDPRSGTSASFGIVPRSTVVAKARYVVAWPPSLERFGMPLSEPPSDLP